MKRFLLLGLLILSVGFFFTGCGGDDGKSGESGKPGPEVNKPADSRENSEGTAVAKEILATFDQASAEAKELVKDKPEPAEVKPKLEALLQKYVEKMKALNKKYLALKDKDIKLFGDANIYLGEHRGKHVFADTVLADTAYYYESSKGDKEVAKLLTKDIIKLLDIAAAH